MNIQSQQVLSEAHETGTLTSSEFRTVNAYGYDAFLSIAFDSAGPVTEASTAWDAATDIITSTAHGFYTGMVVQVSTTGALPTGISGSTDYWVIRVDANTLKLASSLANAQAGTAVNFTAAGSGNHTLTQQTNVATVIVETSPDSATWFAHDLMSAVNIVSLSSWAKHFESAAQSVRLKVAIGKGSGTFVGWIGSKG